MIAERERDFRPAYSKWFGKAVILLVVIRKFHVPVPCSIIGESDEHVRIRINRRCDVDLLKQSILAVEEDAHSLRGWIN
jgi:hypothetical protein